MNERGGKRPTVHSKAIPSPRQHTQRRADGDIGPYAQLV